MTKTVKLALALCLVALVAVVGYRLWAVYSAKQRFEATVAEQQRGKRR